MKKYIKPTATEELVDLESFMVSSIEGVTGVDLEKGGEFTGGEADSRRRNNVWDDGEEW